MASHHSALLILLGLCRVTSGYNGEELDCPENVSLDFFFPGPWIPPGTPNRATLTLPGAFTLGLSHISGAGLGVYTNTFIPANTWLSEYQGEYVPIEMADDRDVYDYAWRVLVDGEEDRLIDAMDESLANWLRYVNCAPKASQENTAMAMCYGHVYFRTSKDVAPGKELLIFCGQEYNDIHLDINETDYTQL